jgi:deoxyribonuclease V
MIFAQAPIRALKMRILDLHPWDVSYAEAVAIQRNLATQVRGTHLKKAPELVAGLDCAFTRDSKHVIACIVVLRIGETEPIEIQHATSPVTFPYIPGLLTFREAPACIAAARKLNSVPDIFIVDGQGVAHPRRLGIAAHLGLVFDKPTIGCAKSRLTGTFEEPKSAKGAWSPLMDGQERIGAVVRSRTGVKPLYVSIGNRITLEESIEVCLQCVSRYRLPEPSRLAHNKVTELKRTLKVDDDLEFAAGSE